MLATYVDPRLTQLTFDQAAAALRWALPDKTTLQALALCLAKTALETGRWLKMWNFNFGNVKASSTYDGMFTCIVLNEVLKVNGAEKLVWFAPQGELVAGPGSAIKGTPLPVPDGHPQTRMRAFPNEWFGAQCYVEVLEQRFRQAYEAMLTGDPYRYVHTLKALHYFTADESTYAKGVASIHREFVAKLQGAPHEEVPIDDGLAAEAERLRSLMMFDMAA